MPLLRLQRPTSIHSQTTAQAAAEAARYDIATIVPGLAELRQDADPLVCIALLDGPVDLSHACLRSANLTNLDARPTTCSVQGAATRHGTQIASVIWGQLDSVIAGVSPQCRGVSLPIFSNAEDGSVAPCLQSDLAQRIVQAVQAGADIINVSAGEFSASATADSLLADSIAFATSNNVLLVASAGNQGSDFVGIPAGFPMVLAVGGMDRDGIPLAFSNWGAGVNGVLAPGQNIPVAGVNDSVTLATGTSYATAIVSGVAALLVGWQLKQGRGKDLSAVREALLEGASSCGNVPSTKTDTIMRGCLDLPGVVTRLGKEGEPIMPQTSEESSVIPNEGAGPVSSVLPADCECKGGGEATGAAAGGKTCSCGSTLPMQKVFAVGQIGYDFGAPAVRDSIHQEMAGEDPHSNPSNPVQFLRYLEKSPWVASNVIWLLSLDTTPLYAIVPMGSYSTLAYERMRQFLKEQIAEGVQYVSIGGIIAGSATLLNGQKIPTVVPDLRTMYSWTINALAQSVVKDKKESRKSDQDHVAGIVNFLNRLYYEYRNPGISSKDRALNSSAVFIARTATIFSSVSEAKMELDSIEVLPSPICSPGSDCWDVRLTFFNTTNDRASRKVFQMTFNVAGVSPTMIGEVRSWAKR